MIIFISNRIQHHRVNKVPNVLDVLGLDEGFKEFEKHFLSKEVKEVNFDTETTGLSPYRDKILLTILGDKDNTFVFDSGDEGGRECSIKAIKFLINFNYLFLGANLKYDYRMCAINFGVKITNLYDVMIAEQRIYQGLGITKDNKDGYSFGLEAICMRRLGYTPEGMNKDIRKEFVGVNPDTFIFYNKHIDYAVGDVTELGLIKDKQAADIEKRQQQLLIYDIEMPLISILAEAELKGFRFDSKKWEELYIRHSKEAHECALRLDKMVIDYRETLLDTDREKLLLKGGKWNKTRVPPGDYNKIGLFGEEVGNKELFGIKTKKLPVNKNALNYDSSDQLVDLFARLKQPFPTTRGLYIVPILNEKTGEVKNAYEEFTSKEEFIQGFIVEHPNHVMVPFFKELIEYRFNITRATNFGRNFIDNYIDKTTGRIHTVYRQCEAITGRLQSGDKKEKYYNSQNIPADKEYRHCFLADEGYSIVTADLSGAETIIMCSKAQDPELKRMAIEEDDIHSPVAQFAWRNIYKFRAGKASGLWFTAQEYWKLKDVKSCIKAIEDVARHDDRVKEWFDLSNSLIITKEINKPMRTKFKANTFGTVYGMFKKKAAKSNNIEIEEGQILIDSIKLMMPKTFAMVEENVKRAKRQGYLILNDRTNSRLWFHAVVKAINNRIPLDKIDFMDIVTVDGQARNSPIQGTQADMIKEMMVEMNKKIVKSVYGKSINLMLQVHDELVYQVPNNIADKFGKVLAETMKEVASRYLTNVEMGVDYHIKPYWTK